MLYMYMVGAVAMMDIPSKENRVVKEFEISLVGDGLEYLIIHDQCIDGAHVSFFILHENSIKFVSKYL